MRSKFKTILLISALAGSSAYAGESTITEAFTNGKASGDFRLRFEGVDQEGAPDKAKALTLRSRLGYKTGSYHGVSAQIEFEDSRVVSGVDDYNDTNGNNAGVFPVVADPETTEVDQFNIQYSNKHVDLKLGRQVLTLDGHRHVGHVGWRQDRQTFDGVSIKGKFAGGKGTATYAKLEQRNRIFAEQKDIDSDDNLFNVSYKTPYGKAVAYVYLLENEDDSGEIDTKGLSFSGSAPVMNAKVLYALEYANQERNNTFDTDYKKFELGAKVKGITGKVGYEELGSDDGQAGFITPLATLHKFNGWADQFLVTPNSGLEDVYVSLAGKVAKGKLVMAYHDYTAHEVATGAEDDLGSEIDVLYAKKFGKTYSAGVKYADYDAGDSAKKDIKKTWVWVGAKF